MPVNTKHACQQCGSLNTRIISTRTDDNGFTTRARRCRDCKHQVFSVEVPITRYQVTSDRHYYAKPEIIKQITNSISLLNSWKPLPCK